MYSEYSDRKRECNNEGKAVDLMSHQLVPRRNILAFGATVFFDTSGPRRVYHEEQFSLDQYRRVVR